MTRHIFLVRGFFDIDEIAYLRSDLPHMVPPVEKFMSRLRTLRLRPSGSTWASPRLPVAVQV